MPRVFILSVHYQSKYWLSVQRRHLDRFVDLDHNRIFAVEGIEPTAFGDNEMVVSYNGDHASGLDALALAALERADKDDWLIFLDSDAFPIRKLSEILSAGSNFIAVLRSENLGDPQPHPSFCAIRASLFRNLEASWKSGYWWKDIFGKNRTDVGGYFLNSLENHQTSWTPLLRTQQKEFHPLFFGFYGTPAAGPMVYHHGAGSRNGPGRVEKILRARQPISWFLEETRLKLNALIFLVACRQPLSTLAQLLLTAPRKVVDPVIRHLIENDSSNWTRFWNMESRDISPRAIQWYSQQNLTSKGSLQ